MFNSRAFGKGLRSELAFFVSAAFIILFAVVPFVQAQETGQITGVVTDSTGAAVPGIVVTATNLNTNASRTATTGSTGTYSLIGLAPAQYQISTPATGGFQGYKAKAEVTVGGKLTFDINLSLGSATTEIQVSADGGTLVNTTTQELSQVVDQQQISQLPSLTRNPYDFVALSGNISSGDNTAAGKSQNETSRGVGSARRWLMQAGASSAATASAAHGSGTSFGDHDSISPGAICGADECEIGRASCRERV